jgi:flagellar hook-basal body complex protein FliE
MAVPGVGGVGGVNLSQLAQLYRQQVLSGTSSTGAAGATGAANGTGTASSAGATSAADPSAPARGADFARSVGDGLTAVENLDKSAASKATLAASGDLHDVQDYVITAMQAQTATELTTTVRNKALDAFNEIMRMPL